jgi:predicted Zn-dependent peptidase
LGKDELQRAKDHLTGRLMLGLETSDQLAGFCGGQEILTREIISPQDLIKKIQAVTVEEIISVGREIFQARKLNLAVIGPFKEKEKFEKILKL